MQKRLKQKDFYWKTIKMQNQLEELENQKGVQINTDNNGGGQSA